MLDTFFTLRTILTERANFERLYGKRAISEAFSGGQKRRESLSLAIAARIAILLLAVSSAVVAAWEQNISSFILGLAGGLLNYLISLEEVTTNENAQVRLHMRDREERRDMGYKDE